MSQVQTDLVFPGGTLSFGTDGLISTELTAIVVAVSSGAGAIAPYTFNSPSSEWVINHNLNRLVNAEAFTSGGLKRMAEIEISLNQVRVRFELPQTGFVLMS